MRILKKVTRSGLTLQYNKKKIFRSDLIFIILSFKLIYILKQSSFCAGITCFLVICENNLFFNLSNFLPLLRHSLLVTALLCLVTPQNKNKPQNKTNNNNNKKKHKQNKKQNKKLCVSIPEEIYAATFLSLNI